MESVAGLPVRCQRLTHGLEMVAADKKVCSLMFEREAYELLPETDLVAISTTRKGVRD